MGKRIVIYSNPLPEGAGAGYKVERVPAPPARGTCFANMPTVSSLQACCNSAPGFHDLATRRIVAMGKVRAEARQRGEEIVEAEDSSSVEMFPPKPKLHVKAQRSFSRGMSVKDRKNGRSGVIIHANAGYTKKSMTPVHKVCDKRGNAWLAKETDLRAI